MLFTRIRPALLLAACTLLCGPGRSDEKSAPPPRPAKTPAEVAKEWEAKFAGRAPDEVGAALNVLAQEWIARKGGYETAQHHLQAQAREVAKFQLQVAGLKAPEAKGPLVLRSAADVDAAIKVAQQRAEYHTARVQLLDTVKTNLEALNTRSRELDRASNDAQDHLNTVQEAVRAAKSIPPDQLPAAFAPKQLADEAERLQQQLSRAAMTALTTRVDLAALETVLGDAKTASVKATAELDELKRTRDAKLAALAYEDKLKGMAAGPLADGFNTLRKEFAAKTKAIAGDEADYKKSVAPVAEARAKLAAVKDPLPSEEKSHAPRPALEDAGRKLVVVQQYLAARARANDERAEKTNALVAALDEQEKKAIAYSTTLDDLRKTAGQLAAAGAEIERRVGRGDLEAAKVPEGVAEATGSTGHRAKLDAEAAALQTTLIQLRNDREQLRKPDAEADGAKALVAALLANVNERIDLHTDLKKLTADYATARPNRSEAEQKRADQRGADRMTKEGKEWDTFLALDRSKPSADLSELLGAYYKELIDLDEKADNLALQKEKLQKLVALTRKEADDVTKLQTLIEKHDKQARGSPEVWFPTEMWAWLAARQAPDGLKSEADAYHAEVARLDAVGGANARRVQALTGNAPEASKSAEQTKLPATGGEIGKTRDELLQARARGLIILGIKIGLVLLAALILPRLIISGLRRAIRGGTDDAGNPAPVLRPLRGVVRLVVWAAALAVVLSILGYDATAFVVAAAVGLLAAALAARPMIADILGSISIFADRRFKVGDVVRFSGAEPARVVDLTWRSTLLRNANGMVSSVPNRTVTEATVENLTRGNETYDTLLVTVSTDKDAGKVINVIRSAMAQCKNLGTDQGVTVVSYVQKGAVKIVQYRFWWFLKDYETRNKTRDEVFARIAVGLSHEDMTGIEIALV
jgi:small-conductance mechanosensitive channel